MNTSAIKYADVWALLRGLGFDCDQKDDANRRICELPGTKTRIVLHDYPANRFMHLQTFNGLRLQLDYSGVMDREKFDQWVTEHSDRNRAGPNNGAPSLPKGRSKATSKA